MNTVCEPAARLFITKDGINLWHRFAPTIQIENGRGGEGRTSVWAAALINMQQPDLKVRQPAPCQLLHPHTMHTHTPTIMHAQSVTIDRVQSRVLDQGVQRNNRPHHLPNVLSLHCFLTQTTLLYSLSPYEAASKTGQGCVCHNEPLLQYEPSTLRQKGCSNSLLRHLIQDGLVYTCVWSTPPQIGRF